MRAGGNPVLALPGAGAGLRPHPAAAVPLVENGELDRWLRRSLGDDVRAEAVASAVEPAGVAGRGANFEDRLISRGGLAVQPAGPIRYKQKSVMVDGFGAALADAFVRNEGYQALGRRFPL